MKNNRFETDFYIMSSSSKVSTLNPLGNDFVSGWTKDGHENTYMLLERDNGAKLVLSGSGKPEFYGVAVGEVVTYTIDTGMGHRRGGTAKVLALGEGADAIKSFPRRAYPLWVMK